jgi:hypothetical protein
MLTKVYAIYVSAGVLPFEVEDCQIAGFSKIGKPH